MMRNPLEKELEGLELPQIPAEIRSRIGRAVEKDRDANLPETAWRSRLAQVAVTGMAIAASAAIVILVTHGDRNRPSGLRGPAMPTKRELRDEHPDMRMTLASYMQAENKTGGTLDSMLNADAAQPIGLARDPMFRAGSQSLDDQNY